MEASWEDYSYAQGSPDPLLCFLDFFPPLLVALHRWREESYLWLSSHGIGELRDFLSSFSERKGFFLPTVVRSLPFAIV